RRRWGGGEGGWGSLGGSPTGDFKGAGLDPRNQLTTKLDRVVQGAESADKERIHAQSVVFENRLSDLFGSADKARSVAKCTGRARNRHPQALCINIALQGKAHQPLSGIVNWAVDLLLQAPSFLAGHGR